MRPPNKLKGSMLLLPGKRAGAWARRMRCLLQPIGDVLHCDIASLAPASSWAKMVMPEDTDGSEDSHKVPAANGVFSPTGLPLMNFYRNIHNQDLRRFLEEVGTNPKEARYWLKHFRRSTDSNHPFAVIHVDSQVFKDMDMMDKLSSGLAFLHRNGMKCVLLHGESPDKNVTSHVTCRKMREDLNAHSFLLANCLEAHGVAARPLFPGCGVFQVSSQIHPSHPSYTLDVNMEPVTWALYSNHVPILQNIAETDSGQLMVADMADVMLQACGVLEPKKVLWVNTTGGFTDNEGDVIPNINFPVDWDAISKQPWCTSDIKQKIHVVGELLKILPQQSSVVVTAASILLNELFTHHGSGTFFKTMEPIHVYHSFGEIDRPRFCALLNKSFGCELKSGYIEDVKNRVHSIYLSEVYNAAAVVLMEPGSDIPYLDKFAVSLAKQGEGVADVLMAHLQQDFPQLFWRSRNTNIINSWYFKHSDGSWGDGDWIVFWYGIANHSESSSLVDIALKKEASFVI